MIGTFTALLFAHALADFAFQSTAMASAKQRRAFGAFVLHILIVAATATLALAPQRAEDVLPILAVTAAHLLIDLAKMLSPADRLGSFLVDQAAHLVTLAAAAWYWPALMANGLWGGFDQIPGLMALIAGLILATRAGGFAVGLLMKPWAGTDLPQGLTNGGMLIGVLERGLLFLFVLVGQPSAIGFLIAAKSVLRFDTARDQKAGEYIIIGTLASFGWALIAVYGTLALLDALPALHILPEAP